MTIQEKKAYRVSEIIRYSEEGHDCNETAKLFGLSKSYVRSICVKNGVKPGQVAREKRNELMRAYKAQGHTMKEVAERFGVSQDRAQVVCKGIAPQKSRPQEYKNGWDEERQIANAIRTIAERAPMFEYAGGYTGSDGFVDLRCKTCGAVIRKSYVSVRHGRAQCENCLQIAVEEKAKQEALRRKIDADRKAWKEAGKKKATQLSFSFCKACGEMFFSERKGVLYCSATCARREHDAIKKDKRIRKIASIIVDKDITVESLYEISNGKCALCGGDCNWGDHVIRDDGTFVVGAMYPSIDHIKPISKGGLHEWSNVQLAHFGCNSKKGNRV